MGAGSWGLLSLLALVVLMTAANVWWMVDERLGSLRARRLQRQRFGMPLVLPDLLSDPRHQERLRNQVTRVVVLEVRRNPSTWVSCLVDERGETWDLERGSELAPILAHAHTLAGQLEVPVETMA